VAHRLTSHHRARWTTSLVVSLTYLLTSLAVTTPAAHAVPGRVSWIAKFDGPGRSADTGEAVVVAPDGETVFVTGSAAEGGESGSYDIATVAYDASTGLERWAAIYDGGGAGVGTGEGACCAAVSPDGSTLYVAGFSQVPPRGLGFVTLAYDTADGTLRWVARLNARSSEQEVARGIGVSPDGSRIFVTGSMAGDFRTVAYDATGERLWIARYPSWGCCTGAVSIGVDPRGRWVYVTGTKTRRGDFTATDIVTVAYRAADGAQRWLARFDGYRGQSDEACCLAVGADGSTVFVVGSVSGRNRHRDGCGTLSYDARTGELRWVARFPSRDGCRFASAVGVGHATDVVFVAGGGEDVATVAYLGSDGSEIWRDRYDGPQSLFDTASSLVVSPDDATVYVTGEAERSDTTGPEIVTIGYGASAGNVVWTSPYDDPPGGYHEAGSIAVAPDGLHVYIAGVTAAIYSSEAQDFLTLALETS
jgi:DNA-binding beta-propeller fold protein YncE